MWKWIKKWKEEDDFVKWAKHFKNKIKGEVKEQFEEAWPSVKNHDANVRGSFVLYWEMRATEGPIHKINRAMTIAYLAYLIDGAGAVGRNDLIEVLNNMIMNIPRINAEITTCLLAIQEGVSNEEE